MPTWLHQGALAAALACCLLAAPAQAQQDAAVIKRATELRQEPAESSASLGALAADTAVTRTMAWYRAQQGGADARALCLADLDAWEATQ